MNYECIIARAYISLLEMRGSPTRETTRITLKIMTPISMDLRVEGEIVLIGRGDEMEKLARAAADQKEWHVVLHQSEDPA